MLVHPQSQLIREPRLLTPGMQPLGNVKLSQNSQALLFYLPNGGHGIDLVTGATGTITAGAPTPQIYDSKKTIYASNGIVRLGNFINLSGGYVINVSLKADSFDDWGGIFTIPNDNGASNYVSLQKNSSEAYTRLQHSSGNVDLLNLTPAKLTANGLHNLTLAWSKSTLIVWLDNEEAYNGAYSDALSTTGVLPGTYIFCERGLSTSTGMNGYIGHFAIYPFITFAVAKSIHNDPYQFLIPA